MGKTPNPKLVGMVVPTVCVSVLLGRKEAFWMESALLPLMRRSRLVPCMAASAINVWAWMNVPCVLLCLFIHCWKYLAKYMFQFRRICNISCAMLAQYLWTEVHVHSNWLVLLNIGKILIWNRNISTFSISQIYHDRLQAMRLWSTRELCNQSISILVVRTGG